MLEATLYDGHIRNLTNLDYPISLSMTISSLLELPGNLAVIWTADTFGRRWSTVASLVVAGLCMVLAGAFRGKKAGSHLEF